MGAGPRTKRSRRSRSVVAGQQRVGLGQRDPAQLVDLARRGERAARRLHSPPAHDLGSLDAGLVLEVAGLAEWSPQTDVEPGLLEHLADRSVDLALGTGAACPWAGSSRRSAGGGSPRPRPPAPTGSRASLATGHRPRHGWCAAVAISGGSSRPHASRGASPQPRVARANLPASIARMRSMSRPAASAKSGSRWSSRAARTSACMTTSSCIVPSTSCRAVRPPASRRQPPSVAAHRRGDRLGRVSDALHPDAHRVVLLVGGRGRGRPPRAARRRFQARSTSGGERPCARGERHSPSRSGSRTASTRRSRRSTYRSLRSASRSAARPSSRRRRRRATRGSSAGSRGPPRWLRGARADVRVAHVAEQPTEPAQLVRQAGPPRLGRRAAGMCAGRCAGAGRRRASGGAPRRRPGASARRAR